MARDEKPSNGWRTGQDPVQRQLRIVATLVFLGVCVYVAVDPNRHIDALPTVGLMVAAVLILVGYERVVRLPYIGRGRKGDDE